MKKCYHKYKLNKDYYNLIKHKNNKCIILTRSKE